MGRRRLAALGAGLLVLAVVGVAISRINLNTYRRSIERALTERLGRDVSVGPMYVSFSPIGLRVDQVVIGEDPAFATTGPFARIGTLYVSPRVLPLLRGRFDVRTLELRAPAIELVRNAAGRWNVASLGGQTAGDGSAALVLNRLRITGGQLGVTDLRSGPPRTAAPPTRVVYRNIDLEVDGYETGRPFGVSLGTTLPAAVLPGTAPPGTGRADAATPAPGSERVTIRGTIGPLVPDAPARTPFSGVAEFGGASVSGLARFVHDAAGFDGSDAIVTGQLTLNARDDRMRATGALNLSGARVRKIELGYPLTAYVDVTYDSGSGRVSIERGELRLGTMPVTVSGTVLTGAALTDAVLTGAARTATSGAGAAGIRAAQATTAGPVLDLRVTAPDASIAEAARLAAAAGIAFGSGTQVAGRLQADVRARGPADRATFEGQIRLRNLAISGRDVPRPVLTPSIDLTLTPNEVRSNEFVAGVDRTIIGARFVLGGYSSPSPTVDATLTTTNADLSSVLSIAHAWGVQAVEGVNGSGRFTMHVRALGPSNAPRYSGTGRLESASFTTPSLTTPFRVPRADLTFASDAVTLENLQIALGATAAQGRITIRRFTAPVVDFELSANTLDVADMQSALAPINASPTAASGDDDSLLRLTTGSGRLRVDRIASGALVLNDVDAMTTLDRGVIRLDPLTASVYGGRHRGAIVVDATRTPASFTLTSRLEDVDANKLATATTSLRDVLYGALASNLRVSAIADGGQGLAKSLNGTISLHLPNGRIAKMDVLQEAATIGRFVTGRSNADRATPVAALTGTFTVTNGVARTDDLRASLAGGTLGATGTLNLVDQAVNMRLTAVLSRDVSQRAGGSRVGGFMTTALANEDGELVVPMLLGGTMLQPRFSPDVQRVAEMKAKNLVPSLRGPGALTDRILGAVTERPALDRAPEAAATAPTPTAPAPGGADAPIAPAEAATRAPATPPKAPADRIQDALRGLLRGRRRTEPPPQPDTPPPAQPNAPDTPEK